MSVILCWITVISGTLTMVSGDVEASMYYFLLATILAVTTDIVVAWRKMDEKQDAVDTEDNGGYIE